VGASVVSKCIEAAFLLLTNLHSGRRICAALAARPTAHQAVLELLGSHCVYAVSDSLNAAVNLLNGSDSGSKSGSGSSKSGSGGFKGGSSSVPGFAEASSLLCLLSDTPGTLAAFPCPSFTARCQPRYVLAALAAHTEAATKQGMQAPLESYWRLLHGSLLLVNQILTQVGVDGDGSAGIGSTHVPAQVLAHAWQTAGRLPGMAARLESLAAEQQQPSVPGLLRVQHGNEVASVGDVCGAQQNQQQLQQQPRQPQHP